VGQRGLLSFPIRLEFPPLTRRALLERWGAAGGYREVVVLAWPLFLSMGSTTILQFIDRMFLSWYSPEAIAAAGPSGIVSRRAITTHCGGKSASKIAPPLAHLPTSGIPEASVGYVTIPVARLYTDG